MIVKPTSRPTKSSSFQFGAQVHQKLPKGLFSNQVGKTEEFLPILSNRGISQTDDFGTLVYDKLEYDASFRRLDNPSNKLPTL